MEFPEKASMAIYFEKPCESEAYIKCVGYNDFNYVKPIKHFRVQRFYTLHIVLEGSGTVKVKDKVYKAKAGDMFFIPPEVNLCYYPDDDNLWKYAWFELLGDLACVYGEKMGFSDDVYVKRCRSFEKNALLLEKIFTDRTKNKSIGYYDVLSVFYKILDGNVRRTENQSTVDEVVDYINCHFEKPDLSVPEICEKLNISHSYLCRIFKNTARVTVKNYITKVRINEACRLLETTDFCIKEVAEGVGFSDDIHFMKVFKSIVKKTPTEYRKSCMYPMG